MDFDDHDNGDEEMGVPGCYNPAPGNSGRPKPGGAPDLTAGNSNRGGVRYRECLKNHAVGIGGHAVDGCGEFTAAGEEGTIDGLRCAACNCHRNFHRKDAEPAAGAAERSGFHSPYSPYYRMPVGYLQYNQMAAAGQQRMAAPPPLLLPSTSGEEMGRAASASGKKRFRSKFTAEQKIKMVAFAERVGWRIQKEDEGEVQRFCEEASIKRHVLKVWMHNNKHTIGRQAVATSSDSPTTHLLPPPPPPPDESIGH